MKRYLIFLFFFPLAVNAQIITTIAGTGVAGYSGDGGPATNAMIGYPNGVAVDKSGNVYITVLHGVRKIDTAGIITSVSGLGSSATYTGEPATAASLVQPIGIAFDDTGNCYISDGSVLKITHAGNIYYVAGLISMSSAFGDLAVDHSGNIYVTDGGTNKVIKIDASGTETVIAGNGTATYAGDGVPATDASLNGPLGVAVDGFGNVFIGDLGNNCVRKVNTSGIITTVAGRGSTYPCNGCLASSAAIGGTTGMMVDRFNDLYFMGGEQLYKMNTLDTLYMIAGYGSSGFAGDGGPATNAAFDRPNGVAMDSAGNIYIADMMNNRIRKITMPSTGVMQVNRPTSEAVIYPNPAHSQMTVYSSDALRSVVLTDVTGDILFVNNNPLARKMELDISSLSPGLYLVRINGAEVQKIIKY